MKRRLLAFAPFFFCAAQAVTLSGVTAGEAPAKARVGAWLVDVTGKRLQEISSAPVEGGKFILKLPETAPGGRALWPVTPESITWPGVTGPVEVPAGLKGAEVRLFAYGDANGNGRRDDTEELLEATPRAGKANVVLVYLDKAGSVTAARGFSVNMKPGWNVLAVELGKTLKANVLENASDLQLSLVR